MFGYIQANVRELKIREYETYRSYYCGLCRALQKRYGRQAGLLLNYDMTFLAILLSGLYEPEEEQARGRCLPHPVRSHPFIRSSAIDYAADMTVLLSYQKAADDRKDKDSLRGGLTAAVLRKDYARLRREYPRQARTLETAVRTLWKAEEEGSSDIDLVAGQTGLFLGEMFAWKNDEWAETLRQAGFYLGKFIYLMDALDDLEKDRKQGHYNLLLELEDKERAMLRDIMTDMMSLCCRAFEKLPIIREAEILRNILYSGVWVKYHEKSI